jgi:hypothetical protein
MPPTDPPITGNLDAELCGWCGCELRFDWNLQPILHPICERRIAERTCCNTVWVDGGRCERCGKVLVSA